MNKIIIIAIIIMSMIICSILIYQKPEPAPFQVSLEAFPTFLPQQTTIPISISYTITYEDDSNSIQYLWDTLNQYTENKKITAGILAVYYRESKFQSNCVCGWHSYYKATGINLCETETKIIDAGLSDGSSWEYFYNTCRINHFGYGLCQWYANTYITDFYQFAQEWNTSIADAEMQCAFTVWSIKNHHNGLWEFLNTCESATTAGYYLGTIYDGSKDGGEDFGELADYYYKLYN